jgi:hypothetical protein
MTELRQGKNDSLAFEKRRQKLKGKMGLQCAELVAV